jgi:hypothetical protein
VGFANFHCTKKDNTVWVVSDFRELNKRIGQTQFPILNISTVLQELEGFTYATALDLRWQPGNGDDGHAPEGALRSVGVTTLVPRASGGGRPSQVRGAVYGGGGVYAQSVGAKDGGGLFS